MAAILNSAILDWAILHRINFTHSFWLNLMMVAILNSAMLDSATAILDSDTLLYFLRFTQKHSHSLWLWIKLIQSDSNSFILTQPDDGSHLQFCQLEFHHLGFSLLSFSSQTHSHLPRLVPTICTKNFTHLFWLNLMMAAILNSAMLNSDTWHHGFRHLVIFSQIHSKTLSLHYDSESN